MKTYTIQSILIVAVSLTIFLPNLSPIIASERIISAETKSATIELVGETHSYYFWAEPGQSVIIEMSRISGSIDPRVQLYDPNGVQIAVSEVGEYDTPRARIEDYQLNTSGIYTIVASDGSWNVDTGDYGLSLVLIQGATKSPQDPNGGCITSGETKTGNIYPAGDTDAYYFYGLTGQCVLIEMSRISGAIDPRVQLYDSNGVRIAVSEVGEYDTPRAGIEDYQLNTSGIYTIVVSDGSWNVDTGEYGLSLVLTGSTTTSLQDYDGGDMTIGRTQSGTILPKGDMDSYVFYGQLGQGIVIEIDRLSGAIDPRIQLYDPCGIRVAVSEVGEYDTPRARIEDYQLNMSGLYTIVVSDGSWNVDTGEYGLSVSVIPPIEPYGRYPYDPQPAEGQSIDYRDPNYHFTDNIVENMILPDGTMVTRRSGAYLLSWWSVIDATGYDVYFSSAPCMPLEIVAENITDPWLPMPVIEGGQICFWRVIAHTPAGDIQGPTWWFDVEPCPYSLTISAIGQGSIMDPNEGFHEYSYGEVVSVTAVAETNFEFVRWEGTAVEANKTVVEHQDYMGSTIQVTVHGAYTLKAVFEEIIYDFRLDSDPGWIMEGQWEYGIPTGQGGREHGNPDPSSGYTGQHVIGVNLNGDYDVTIGEPYSLVAGPFDLRGYRSIHLRFWSWLNTDCAGYVKNSLEMSLDGKTWLLVLHNPEQEDITNSEWSRWECGIGSWADGQPEVYLRWSYQVLTERAYPYSGWNLDDIQLIGRK